MFTHSYLGGEKCPLENQTSDRNVLWIYSPTHSSVTQQGFSMETKTHLTKCNPLQFPGCDQSFYIHTESICVYKHIICCTKTNAKAIFCR